MEYSAFMNINELADEAKKELELFYEYLLFKYKRKDKPETKNKKDRFSEFLSGTIKVDDFRILGREERNER